MAYSVDVLYTKNEDFSNPSTETESGQPSSIEITGLDSYETYYTKAVLKNDGVVEDESQMTSFQTLPAGTITLNHNQTNRSGYGYDVEYIYSSTYAPSWATLSTNGSTFQGFINSAQHSVSFWVTGLTPGTAYLTSVTMGDIYGETATVQGSIVATVVNEITITGTHASYTSVDVDVSYILDGGFYVGYVEWWLGTQDPSTDQSDGHEYFTDGDSTVTIQGLNDGTEYKFRASVTLNDQVTTINSNVVAASTNVNYANRYFTIVNRGIGTGVNKNGIKITTSQASSIDYSIDNGATWSTRNIPSNTSTTIASLNPGKKLMLKATSAFLRANKTFDATDIFDIEGNIASLLTTGDFRTASNLSLSMPKLFYNCTKLLNAENAVFDTCASIAQNGCEEMFYGCSALVTSPKRLPSTVGANACERMFAQCRSLTNVPELPATITQNYCYDSMFSYCISLTEAQDELPATYIREASYRSMFFGCLSLQKTPDLSKATSVVSGAMGNMFYNCELLDTVYAPSFRSWDRYITQDWLYGVAPEGVLYKPAELEIPTDTPNGVPEGWTTQDY